LAPRFSIFLLLGCCAAQSGAQAFGRFGYVDHPSVSGMTLDESGFSAKHPRADHIKFGSKSKIWRPLSCSWDGMTIALDGKAGSPQKIQYCLTAPGVTMYFGQGIRLNLTSTAAPYLSWSQGSVTDGVPTPAAKWLVLSFRDDQPPIAFGFPDAPCSLQISGKPGSWIVKSSLEFKGWVRVGLPLGTQGLAANTAGSLGRLAETMVSEAELWTRRPEPLPKPTIESDARSLTATWSFASPGAIVPAAAIFASWGGDPVQVLSAVTRLNMTTEDGPVDVATGNTIQIRFPSRRVPSGRFVADGLAPVDPIGTASPLDIPSVIDLANESLSSSRDSLVGKAAEDTFGEYLAQASYSKEPWTQAQLPYSADGTGYDVAAAEAYLMQAIDNGQKGNQEPNSLLTSIAWRQDWSTWLPANMAALRARRAALIASVAGAMCPEPEYRLTAAMFQAGAAAERGLALWKVRRGLLPSEQEFIEPLLGIRQALYLVGNVRSPDYDFGAMMLSPVRLYGAQVLVCDQGTLSWNAIDDSVATINLASAFPISVTAASNLSQCTSRGALGMLEVTYVPVTPGPCQLKVDLGGQSLPKAVTPPRYSEPLMKRGPH
jgi:hypothetical protein